MKEIVRTARAPAAIGPYSQAVKAGGFLFISGQLPIDPATGKIVDGSTAEQAERVLRNIRSILDSSGTNLNGVVKVTIFLQNIEDITSVNEVYYRFFHAEAPARITVEVSRLPLDALISIDAIAWLG